jgi:2-aminoadipate transaminase
MHPRIVEIQKAAAERDDVIGLAGGLPASELLPRDALARALAEVAARRDDALQYGWPEGTEQIRCWVASRLATRGAAVDPDRVIVTAGAQQALSIAGGVLRGQTIGVGDATYPAAIEAFRSAGAPPVAHGGDVRYAITGVSNPQGRAVAHRELLAGAGSIIADEAYAELRFDGTLPRPLVADAPDRVWHVGTISKTVAPGLRVGWLVPPPAAHDEALQRKQAADLQTASISQAALALMFKQLDYDALVATARADYARRAAGLVDALRRHGEGLSFAEPEGGFSIWVETADPGTEADELALLEAALAEGVMFGPGSLFRVESAKRIAFRLAFSTLPPERADEGVARLARALARWRSR